MQDIKIFLEQNTHNFLVNKKVSVKHLGSEFSEEELKHDLIGLDDLSMALKKELNKKYNVGSNRWEDIRVAICIELLKIRKHKKEFDTDDMNNFRHLTKGGIPGTYKNFVEYVKNESFDFLRFLLEKQESVLKSIKCIRAKCTLFDMVTWNVGKDWNYYYSYADKWKIDYYKMIKKYLEEKNEL